MIGQMDRNLIFGCGYGKPLFPATPRPQQAARLAEAHCTSTRDGIDLPNVWMGVGQYA